MNRGDQRMACRLSTIIALGLSLSGTAQATTMVTFSGEVDSLSSGSIPGVAVGDLISGALTFDPTTTDGQALPWIGYYPDAINAFQATIGDQQFSLHMSPSSSEIDVINDDFFSGTYRDTMLFRVAVDETTSGSIGSIYFLQLTFSIAATSPPSVLLDDTLLSMPDLDAFTTRRGFIRYFPVGASAGTNFVLTSVDVTTVPEPAALGLVGLGLIGMGFVRRHMR